MIDDPVVRRAEQIRLEVPGGTAAALQRVEQAAEGLCCAVFGLGCIPQQPERIVVNRAIESVIDLGQRFLVEPARQFQQLSLVAAMHGSTNHDGFRNLEIRGRLNRRARPWPGISAGSSRRKAPSPRLDSLPAGGILPFWRAVAGGREVAR